MSRLEATIGDIVLKKFIIIGIIFVSCSNIYSWRPYNRFRVGSDANGVGCAYVADVSSELAIHHNPAGLVQLDKKLSVAFEIYANIIIPDILANNIRIHLDYFPFFAVICKINKLDLGLSTTTLFDAFQSDETHIRSVKFSFAYPLFENFSIGGGLGPVVATEGNGIGTGFAFNIGLLWKTSARLQIGLCFQSPFTVNWSTPAIGYSLVESFPFIVEGGIIYAINKNAMLFISLEYIDIDRIIYTLNNIDSSPVFEQNIFSRLHPHAGIQFVEKISGARISLGLMMDSVYDDGGGRNQYLLTIGIKAYGGSGKTRGNTIFTASIIDSLLFSLINPYNSYEEKINISFSFKILSVNKKTTIPPDEDL